jgi:hypothetical protein
MGIRGLSETSAGFTLMKFQVCIQKVGISANPRTGDMSARSALVPDYRCLLWFTGHVRLVISNGYPAEFCEPFCFRQELLTP